MPIYQAYNKKIKAWVKYHFKGGFKVLDVKTRKPKIPFKNILKKGKYISASQNNNIIGRRKK